MNLATALRTAAEAALRADPTVISAFSPGAVQIFVMAAPTNPSFPYVVQRVEIVGDDTECAEGAEAYLMLDVYAREETFVASAAKAEAIAAAARRALVAPLVLDGHVVDDWTFEGDRPIGDPHPATEHRHLRIRYLTTADA